MDSATAFVRPTRRRRSLGQRVALTFALLCSLVALVQGVVAYYAVEGAEDAMSDALVQSEMQLFAERFRAGDAQAAPSSSRLRGYAVAWPAESARVPAFARDLLGGPHELYVDGRTYHVMARDEGGSRLVLILDTTVYEDHVHAFRSFVIASILACSAAALLFGWLLSRHLLRPLAMVTDALQKLAPGSGARHDGDESTRLLDAFDRYQRQVEQLIAKEKQFTSNASHELRTPLTALRTSCELLQLNPALDHAARGRVDEMVRVIDGMTATVSASLKLARDRPAAIELMDVREMLEDVLLPLRAALGRDGVAVVVDVPAGLTLRTDRQALQMVLQNLLRNAMTYTEAGAVRVTAGRDWIEIRDTGRGIASEHLPQVFERHFSAARTDLGGAGAKESYGIGLAIVRQLCDRHGWTVSLRSETREGPDRGTTARLELRGGD
jgi:signal transduction histidine kinase